MKLKKIIAAVAAAAAVCVPFQGSAGALTVPSAVFAEEKPALPDWVPSDFGSALEFRNTYGKTHVEDGLICIVFEQQNDYNEDIDRLRYSLMTTENVMDTLCDEVYTSEQSKTMLEVAVYAPTAAGDIDTAIIDTWAKSSSLDLGYLHAKDYFTFTADNELNVTETDIFSWLPDCVSEYGTFYKENGQVSAMNGCVVFCLTSNAGTPYSWNFTDTGSPCFEMDKIGDCAAVSDVPLDGSAVPQAYAFKAVKDGHAKISCDLMASYTTGEVIKSAAADCIVLDDAQTVLLSGDMRVTLVDSETGEMIPFSNDTAPSIWADTVSDDGTADTGQFATLEKNPAVLKNLGKYLAADSISFGLNEDSLPEGYSLPGGTTAPGFYNGTSQPENFVTVKKLDNGAADVVFRLDKIKAPDLNPGETRITLLDKDTGKLIPSELFKNHPWYCGTYISMTVNGQKMYTGPVMSAEQNPTVMKTDLASLYSSADEFRLLCDDPVEFTYYDNGSLDIVVRTKLTVTGNINGDGDFNIADAVALQQMLLGKPGVSVYDWAQGDFDFDDRMSVFDLCLMKSALVEKTGIDQYADYDFQSQYIRTGNGQLYQIEPQKVIIRSRAELDEYISNDTFGFGLSADPGSSPGTKISFEKAVEDYTEEWFKDHQLILVTVQEPSGSITHKVTQVTNYAIRIERMIPRAQTADIASWQIVISLDKDAAVSGDMSLIFYDNIEE